MSRSSLAVLAAAVLTFAGCESQPLDTTETSDPGQSPATQQTPAQQPSTQQTPAQQPRAQQVRQSSAPAPKPAPAPQPITLTEGSLLEVQLTQDLNSGTNQSGDPFSVSVMTPLAVDGQTAVPAGSIVRGTLQDVKAAKKGGGHATMTLQFEELELPSGYRTPIVASLSEETSGTKKRNAAIIGGSAAGGAILGKVLGNDNKDAAIGAIVAGAIATGVVLSQDGKQVELPAGSSFTIELGQTLQVPRTPPNS